MDTRLPSRSAGTRPRPCNHRVVDAGGCQSQNRALRRDVLVVQLEPFIGWLFGRKLAAFPFYT
jgi:hypothetical protein